MHRLFTLFEGIGKSGVRSGDGDFRQLGPFQFPVQHLAAQFGQQQRVS